MYVLLCKNAIERAIHVCKKDNILLLVRRRRNGTLCITGSCSSQWVLKRRNEWTGLGETGHRELVIFWPRHKVRPGDFYVSNWQAFNSHLKCISLVWSEGLERIRGWWSDYLATVRHDLISDSKDHVIGTGSPRPPQGRVFCSQWLDHFVCVGGCGGEGTWLGARRAGEQALRERCWGASPWKLEELHCRPGPWELWRAQGVRRLDTS